MATEDTYLDLGVGPFALAIAARAVIAVRQDVSLAAGLDVHGARVPLCDLGRLFGGPARTDLPFAIAIEAAGRTAAVGVDHVGHLRRRDAPTLRRVPGFGLWAPELFAGGFRDGERLLLVLDPVAVVTLTHRETRPI